MVAQHVDPSISDVIGLDVLIEGQPVRPLTRRAKGSEDWDNQPKWSPDGRRVAFARAYGQRPGLYVARLGEGRSRRVVTGRIPEDSAAITWSPDGGRIAFLRDGSVFAVNSDGGPTRLALPGGKWWCKAPSWTPDGRQLVAACSGRLWIVNADGSRRHPVPGERDAGGGASWSPDGSRIAYARRCNPGLSEDVFCDVAVTRPDGSGRRTLVRRDRTGPTDERPVWTSAERLLVGLWGYKRGILAVNASTGKTRKAHQETSPILATGPNGTYALPGRGSSLDIFNRDGKRLLHAAYPPTFGADADIDVWLGSI
jgi:Tol biopolymer transport system component